MLLTSTKVTLHTVFVLILECICPDIKMYLSNLLNVFVQFLNWILDSPQTKPLMLQCYLNQGHTSYVFKSRFCHMSNPRSCKLVFQVLENFHFIAAITLSVTKVTLCRFWMVNSQNTQTRIIHYNQANKLTRLTH